MSRLIANTSCAAETGQRDPVAVNVRLGATLVNQIDAAAIEDHRTRNSWVTVALASALTHGLPANGITKLTYLDVVSDRLPVMLRLPRDLLAQLDQCAQKAGVNRTILINYVLIGTLGRDCAEGCSP